MSSDQSSKPEHQPGQQPDEAVTPEENEQVQADNSPADLAETGEAETGSAQAVQGTATPGAASRGRAGWLITVLAMFVLFAAGIVVLWLEQQQLGQRLQRAEQYGQNLQASLSASDQQQRQAMNANDELQRSLQAIQELVMAQQQAPQLDDRALVLHQAMMLVRMAQAQLQVRRDPGDALLAMQWALEKVQEQGNELAGVREQLANDIRQLQQLPRQNNLALVQQLASLIDSANKLPLRVAAIQHPHNLAEPAPEPEHPEYTGWRSAVQAVWQELKQLVVLRQRDEPIQPLMSAEREQMLRDVLRLRLDGLQVQLMRETGAAQNVARARVLSWLRQWFDEGHADVIAMRDWLNSLPEPSSAMPDLQTSITALSSAIRSTGQTDARP